MSDKTTKHLDDQMRVNRSIWKDTNQKGDLYNTDKSIKYAEYIEDDDPELLEKIKNIDKVTPFVKVFHEDIYATLSTMHEEGFRSPPPLLINPGNNNFPIPGVKKGAFGPEMDLFRRSNYHLALEEQQFSILEYQCLYSPTVVIFKNEQFKRMENPVSISILNIPPLHSPRLISMQNPKGKGYIEVFDSPNDEEKARRKIHMMFKIAILHGHDTIVLTNYGGDINGNPTEKTIELINEAARIYPIHYVFFAIKTNELREKDKEFHLYHAHVQR